MTKQFKIKAKNFILVASHRIPKFFTPKNNHIQNIITHRLQQHSLQQIETHFNVIEKQCQKSKDWRWHTVMVDLTDEVMELENMCSPFARTKPQTAEFKSFERVKTIYPYWVAAPANINPCYSRIKGSFCANSVPLSRKPEQKDLSSSWSSLTGCTLLAVNLTDSHKSRSILSSRWRLEVALSICRNRQQIWLFVLYSLVCLKFRSCFLY